MKMLPRTDGKWEVRDGVKRIKVGSKRQGELFLIEKHVEVHGVVSCDANQRR